MRKSWLGPRCTGRYGDIKNNHYINRIVPYDEYHHTKE